jgi:D-arabinose 1-dehydrogenase-like Zn-dependent alcohol dehydrogenase
MLGAVIPEFGRIKVAEVDEPQVRSSTDVLVKVAAAGVCRTDLETMDGGLASVYGAPLFPYIPGHETAGWVETVGADVHSVAPGDPVLLHPFVTCGQCDGCRSGLDMYCSRSRFPGVDAKTWGGFAEYVVTGERAVIPLSPAADLVELAGYADAGITAYHAINRLLPHLRPDATVVAIGVGGVGHFGVQLLRRMTSCIVIGLDFDFSRAELAKELGAQLAFSGSLASMLASVREATGGGADAVIDFAGIGPGEVSLLDFVSKGGAISLVGANGSLAIDTVRAVVQEVTIIANLVGTYTELKELVGFQSSGLRSLHSRYELADVEAAVEDLRQGRVAGRAVLIP